MSPLRTALLGYGLAGRVIHRPLLEAVDELQVTHVVTAGLTHESGANPLLRVPEAAARSSRERSVVRVRPS